MSCKKSRRLAYLECSFNHTWCNRCTSATCQYSLVCLDLTRVNLFVLDFVSPYCYPYLFWCWLSFDFWIELLHLFVYFNLMIYLSFVISKGVLDLRKVEFDWHFYFLCWRDRFRISPSQRQEDLIECQTPNMVAWKNTYLIESKVVNTKHLV